MIHERLNFKAEENEENEDEEHNGRVICKILLFKVKS